MNVDHDSQTTGEVIGAAIAVHRDLGPGLDEAAYESALSRKLHSLGVHHQRQVSLPIRYRDATLDCGYRYDLIVDSRLPIELKAVEQLLPVHQAQLLTYMRLGAHRLGLLINFDVPAFKDGIRRMALTHVPNIDSSLTFDEDRFPDDLSASIWRSAVEVFRTMGPGLLRSAYETCFCHELTLRRVRHVRQCNLPLQFEGQNIGHNVQLPIVVAGTVPVVCLSVANATKLHTCRIRARLRQTGWPFGFLINFNTNDLNNGFHRISI